MKINENKKLNILKNTIWRINRGSDEFTIDKANTSGMDLYLLKSYAYHADISFDDSVDRFLDDNE